MGIQSQTVSHAAIAIRSAGENDIERIRALAQHIWPLAYDGILKPGEIDNMLLRIYSADNLRSEMREAGHRFWIASAQGQDVGFVSGYRDGDTAWIKKIYVNPACKGMGIGKALVSMIEKAFAPVREVRLLVNPGNMPAMDFYRHIGFAEAGRKHVQMGDFEFLDYIFARPTQDNRKG
jgi:ribosomal protein S18 acetylase RimI-like enzyme